VTAGDIDALGHVSNVAYLRWVQEAAQSHSTAVGLGYEAYRVLGVVFVVRRHEIDYLRPALPGDEIELVTWIESWSAASSVRRTRVVRVADGVDLARAATTWALVSLDHGKPCRIPPELRAAFADPGGRGA
jgi:acyl-CoA thioester hydrolase